MSERIPAAKRNTLRLCKAERLHNKGRCRAWAINNGYCWYHHLSVFNTVMWGDHEWFGEVAGG